MPVPARHMTYVTMALLVAAAALWFWGAEKSPPPPRPLPEIDISRMHAPVAEAVNEALARLRRDPASRRAWGELAELLTAHQMPEAVACLEAVEELDPESARWPYLRGFALEETNLEAAAAAYERSLQLQPDQPAAWWRLGQVRLRLDRLRPAREALERFAELARRGGEPPRQQAAAAFALGQLAGAEENSHEALAQFEAATRLAPESRAAWLERARWHRRLGQIDMAAQCEREAERRAPVRLEPSDPMLDQINFRETVSRRLAQNADAAFARQDWRTAARYYEQLAAARPDWPRPVVQRAICLIQLNEVLPARALLQQAVRDFDEDPLAHAHLAACEDRLGNHEAARRSYEASLALKPDDARTRFAYGLFLHERGEHVRAVDELRRAVAADPSHAPSHLALGKALASLRRWDEALRAIDAAQSLAPGDPEPARQRRRVIEARDAAQ